MVRSVLAATVTRSNPCCNEVCGLDHSFIWLCCNHMLCAEEQPTQRVCVKDGRDCCTVCVLRNHAIPAPLSTCDGPSLMDDDDMTN